MSTAKMYFEEFFVIVVCSILISERSKVSQKLSHGVRVLLWRGLGDENVVKEFLQAVVEESTSCSAEGRTFLRKKEQLHRDYDDTKGFPGEDIC